MGLAIAADAAEDHPLALKYRLFAGGRWVLGVDGRSLLSVLTLRSSPRTFTRYMALTLATWNINSVRLRIGLVRRFLRKHAPDVLCLQETKSPDEHFPREAFEELGYSHMLIHGMKGYNGVATLSRLPLAGPRTKSWCAREDCRHVVTELPGGIELHNLYISPPAATFPIPEANPKFAHKLQFLDEGHGVVRRGSAQGQESDPGRRSQHRAARDRRLVAQVSAQGGEPHADRGGEARQAPGSRRLCRRRAPRHSAGAAALHLVVRLSRAGLARFRPRAAARSHLGHARRWCRSSQAPRYSSPCAAGSGAPTTCR